MNSNDNILVIDYASFCESEYINKNKCDNITNSTYVVNPKYSHLINKIIIVNLPVEIPLEKLTEYNKVISRFPTVEGIEVHPYELPKDRELINKDDYSLLILNKDMLLDIDNLDVVLNNKFLLSTDVVIDNYITLAGYLLLKNKFEDQF